MSLSPWPQQLLFSINRKLETKTHHRSGHQVLRVWEHGCKHMAGLIASGIVKWTASKLSSLVSAPVWTSPSNSDEGQSALEDLWELRRSMIMIQRTLDESAEGSIRGETERLRLSELQQFVYAQGGGVYVPEPDNASSRRTCVPIFISTPNKFLAESSNSDRTKTPVNLRRKKLGWDWTWSGPKKKLPPQARKKIHLPPVKKSLQNISDSVKKNLDSRK
jgi:hypothetical protein